MPIRLSQSAHLDQARLATDIDHNYSYDNASRITSFNTGATTRGYGYDDAGQLTSKTGGTGESYAYDDNGNRTSKNGQGVTTGPANRLTSDGTYTYLYDGEGNITSRTAIATGATTTYTWDHRNRLVNVSERPWPRLPAQVQSAKSDKTISQANSTSGWTTSQLTAFAYANPVIIAQLASATIRQPLSLAFAIHGRYRSSSDRASGIPPGRRYLTRSRNDQLHRRRGRHVDMPGGGTAGGRQADVNRATLNYHLARHSLFSSLPAMLRTSDVHEWYDATWPSPTLLLQAAAASAQSAGREVGRRKSTGRNRGLRGDLLRQRHHSRRRESSRLWLLPQSITHAWTTSELLPALRTAHRTFAPLRPTPKPTIRALAGCAT